MEHTYDEATLDLLRLTIPTYGIIVPIIQRSGTNEIIDGRHRLKIRDELAEQGIKIMLPVHHVDTDNPAEIDAIVNSIRRPWQDTEQRRELVRQLREKGHSHQRIADAVGAGETTVRRDLRLIPAGPPNGGPADCPPAPSKGKDGKTYRPQATQDEIAKAWSMKESSMSLAAIARDTGRNESTIREWFKKERPIAPPPHPSTPKPEPLQLTPPFDPPKPQKPKIPDNLKQAHQREQKRIKERWQPIAEHLKAAHDLIRAEKDRLCKEYAGAHGSLIMQRRWQQMAEIWAESGMLSQFAEITGEPEAVTLNGLLSEMERSSRMANSWITFIAVYTGCRPDPTRYQPQSEVEP
jgi:ParB-like chromosome segregation protein Spo0J